MTGSSEVPKPTRLYRIVHVDNLPTLIQRGALHAPNSTPADGLPYRTIHNTAVQSNRSVRRVPCGPGGTIHDYVPFYFGPLSVMQLNLHTSRVAGYEQGQAPLVYLVTTVERVLEARRPWVFADGHGLAAMTSWYDDLAKLSEVDWSLVGERYWRDTPDDNDRMRRKQAEFLVWEHLPWSAIRGIAVLNGRVKGQVEETLGNYPGAHAPRVLTKRNWYY
ncbi:MAG TPA: DUF4433 domain-containing protein [Longimicrobium sp.]